MSKRRSLSSFASSAARTDAVPIAFLRQLQTSNKQKRIILGTATKRAAGILAQVEQALDVRHVRVAAAQVSAAQRRRRNNGGGHLTSACRERVPMWWPARDSVCACVWGGGGGGGEVARRREQEQGGDGCSCSRNAPLFLTARCCLPLRECSNFPVAVTLKRFTALFFGLIFVCTWTTSEEQKCHWFGVEGHYIAIRCRANLGTQNQRRFDTGRWKRRKQSGGRNGGEGATVGGSSHNRLSTQTGARC
jgi:hypothetical protein